MAGSVDFSLAIATVPILLNIISTEENVEKLRAKISGFSRIFAKSSEKESEILL